MPEFDLLIWKKYPWKLRIRKKFPEPRILYKISFSNLASVAFQIKENDELFPTSYILHKY